MNNEQKEQHQKQLIFGYLKQIQELETEKERYRLLYINYKERYAKFLKRVFDLLNLQEKYFTIKSKHILRECQKEEAQIKFVIEKRLQEEQQTIN
jgi:hypothetical protein